MAKQPMPAEALATFASNRRLNAELRRVGLPKAKALGALLRAAAAGDETAAAQLDEKWPAWREIAERASAAAAQIVSTE